MKKPTSPGINTYTAKERNMYLVGLAGQNMIYNIISSGLMYYFQSVIFLPAMVYSIIVAIARVWDAINDPMMGTIVDKTQTKWGKCKPYLLFVPAVVMVVTILCFINGRCTYNADGSLIMGARNILIIAWAGISYILWGMSYTAGDIPLWGVTSLMTEDAKDRSNILALARIVATAGVVGMLVQFLAAPLQGTVANMYYAIKGIDVELHPELALDNASQLQYSFIFLAVIVTIISSVLFQFAGLGVKEKVQKQVEKKPSMAENFKTMWSCKPFRQLLVSGVLRSPIQLLSTVALTLVMYFFFDNDPGKALVTDNGLNIILIIQVLIIGIGIFGGMLAASAITPNLATKFEKKSLYNFYSIVGAIPFGLVFVIYKIAGAGVKTSIVWSIIMGVVFFAASWAQGGLNVLQSIMIADCVDYEEYHNGNRPDGVFFSGQSFITKLSAGIATVISGAVYSIVKWSGSAIEQANDALANGTAHFAEDYSNFASAMFFLVAIPPMIGMILSAIPTLKYALSNEEHKKILATLVSQRHGDDDEAAE